MTLVQADHFADRQDGPGYMPPSQNAMKYMDAFLAVEHRLDLPNHILVALAWEESRFREDVITCRVVSEAGAAGLMQIIPRWHPDANPCEPHAAIAYAGLYLKWLYQQTGDWYSALAAYNWGISNVKKRLKEGKPMPHPVHLYATTILENIGFMVL